MKTDSFCIKNGKDFRLSQVKCNDTLHYSESDQPAVEEEMRENILEIAELQDKLYAQNTHAILLIIQAMDAAGKDGTIKHVTSGLNPQGCHVTCFKAPSYIELDHDYLWRISMEVPQRGTIGIFNRSHYEEVLVAKVHDLPAIQPLPKDCMKDIWNKRYRQINDFERYLFENGIIPVKIFLHEIRVSQPIKMEGLVFVFPASTIAPANPSLKARSGVSSLFATPRTPSVPNILFIAYLPPNYANILSI